MRPGWMVFKSWICCHKAATLPQPSVLQSMSIYRMHKVLEGSISLLFITNGSQNPIRQPQCAQHRQAVSEDQRGRLEEGQGLWEDYGKMDQSVDVCKLH